MRRNMDRRLFFDFIQFCLLSFFVYVGTDAQFRSEQTKEYYDYPYNRPSTSRPVGDKPPISGRGGSRNKDYHSSDTIRYRGSEYNPNKWDRTHTRYGSRDRDSLRVNYNPYDENIDLEFRNTIFDRWRPDLQGEQRPGETPGINLPLAEDVFVSTDSGKLQGFYVYLYDQPDTRPEERPANKRLDLQRHVLNVTVFLGIPYAQPPRLEGRFKPPRKVHNWHTTWQAIDYSPACPQNLKYVGASMGIRKGIDEDCLYLNVFTPSLSVNAREKYPVMFYIHGGNFDHGAGSQFPAHMLSAAGEVVVVTINYRLGALGFLSTGDYHSPGNYGLMDMALALEWVYNNIRFFNGDRERISVFGPGAGGAAAGLLAVLPKTRHWVAQVIAESGSPLADWAAIDDPYRVQNTSRVFGLELGCNVDNSKNLMDCLVTRDVEELATAPIIPDVGTFAWSPVVDGNFTVPGDDWLEEWSEKDWHILPQIPLKLYEENKHHPLLKYLTGCNRDEAANLVYEDIRLSKNSHVVTEEFFNARIREWVLHYNYTLNPDGAYDAIKWMYTFWPDPYNTTHIREQYISMLSDALYKSAVDQIVKVLINSTGKRSVPTYYYVLNTTIEALKLPLWREVPNNLEYYFVSGAPFMDPELYPETLRVGRNQWTESDRNISRFMMLAFANFAKFGNPTQIQVEPIKMNWEVTIDGALKYLSINNTFNTTMHYNYRQLYSSFWYEYMPMVVREYVPTPPPPRNPWLDMKEPVTATMYGLLAIVVAILVILCICFGLWKSARRQRNKALDDLSYYSTENLDMNKDEDYEVRNYLDKLGEIRQGNPSRSDTVNTAISADRTLNSRPVTPNSMTSQKAGYTDTQRRGTSLSQPDFTRYPSKEFLEMKQSQSIGYQTMSKSSSLAKPLIMELEEPSRVIRGRYVAQDDRGVLLPQQRPQPQVVQYMGNNQQVGIPEMAYNTSQPMVMTYPMYAQPVGGVRVLPPQQIVTYAQPHFENHSQHIQTRPQTLDIRAQTLEPQSNAAQTSDSRAESAGEMEVRASTPSASSVTFGISMKPRVIETGSVLNTDL